MFEPRSQDSPIRPRSRSARGVSDTRRRYWTTYALSDGVALPLGFFGTVYLARPAARLMVAAMMMVPRR